MAGIPKGLIEVPVNVVLDQVGVPTFGRGAIVKTTQYIGTWWLWGSKSAYNLFWEDMSDLAKLDAWRKLAPWMAATFIVAWMMSRIVDVGFRSEPQRTYPPVRLAPEPAISAGSDEEDDD